MRLRNEAGLEPKVAARKNEEVQAEYDRMMRTLGDRAIVRQK
jgi:hypothetical protein